MKIIESKSEDDIALYRCPKGVLFQPKNENDIPLHGGASDNTPAVEEKKAAPRKAKGQGGGFNAMADEEWEKQAKRELTKRESKHHLWCQLDRFHPRKKSCSRNNHQRENSILHLLMLGSHALLLQ